MIALQIHVCRDCACCLRTTLRAWFLRRCWNGCVTDTSISCRQACVYLEGEGRRKGVVRHQTKSLSAGKEWKRRSPRAMHQATTKKCTLATTNYAQTGMVCKVPPACPVTHQNMNLTKDMKLAGFPSVCTTMLCSAYASEAHGHDEYDGSTALLRV